MSFRGVDVRLFCSVFSSCSSLSLVLCSGLHLLPKVGIITLAKNGNFDSGVHCQKWKLLLEPHMATLTLLFKPNMAILSVGYVYCQKWELLLEPN